jgi:L-malate glycosyltransferase
MSSLNIFILHCSDLLTDYKPHGDGLIAHGFISTLARRGHRLHVAAPLVELKKALHPNITIYPIKVKRSEPISARIEYMVRVRSLFRRLAKQFEFDLIHQLNPVFSGMSLALAGFDFPLVLGTYVARWPDESRSSNLRARWTSQLLGYARNKVSLVQQRQAQALLLTTPAAFNRLPRPEAVRDRIHVLPHGVDTELFSPALSWDSPENLLAEQQSPSILFFANVGRRKGIFTLINALHTVVSAVPGCRVRIAGDGPELSEVKERVATLACAGNVEFLGNQQREDAPILLRNSSVYCLPSFGEPYATTVIEAMSCARALVVTDSGGLPYLVKEEGGHRVPTGDPASLSAALIDLLRSPEKRRAMGRFNRSLVESTMTWDKVGQQLEEVYEAALQRFASTGRRVRRKVGFHFQSVPGTAMQEKP